jgi:hypothetical protein
MSRYERTADKFKRGSKVRLPDAASEHAEATTWKCASCDRMVEGDEGTYCMICDQYWRDVANGVFDD